MTGVTIEGNKFPLYCYKQTDFILFTVITKKKKHLTDINSRNRCQFYDTFAKGNTFKDQNSTIELNIICLKNDNCY